VSDLFKLTAAAHVDSMCVIRSMHADVPNHEPSLMLMNCGDGRLPRPSLGSWLTTAWARRTRTCPASSCSAPAVADRRSAKLAVGVSTRCLAGHARRYPAHRHSEVDRKHSQRLHDARRAAPQLDLVRALNEKHLEQRPGDAMLEARIQSFELAFRMQREAAEAFDVSREPTRVREMYGNSTHGRQLLITRRLLECGVRVVQVWSGGGQPWDNHDGIEANHKLLARGGTGRSPRSSPT